MGSICVLVGGHIRHLETAHNVNEEWLHILRIVRACASTKDNPGRDRGESRHLEAGGCLSMS